MAEVVEKVLIQIDLEVDKTTQNLIKTRGEIEKFKGELKSNTVALEELRKSGVTSGDTYKYLQTKIEETKAQVGALTKEAKQYELALVKQQQAENATEGSLNKMRAALAAGQIIYASYSEEQKKTDQTTIEFGKSLEFLKQQILEEAKGIGSTVENVGNYESATKGMTASLKGAIVEVQKLAQEFGSNSKQATDAQAKVDLLMKAVDSFSQKVSSSGASITSYEAKIVELNNQLKEATDESKKLSTQLGESNQQTIEAQQKVLQLAESIDTLNKEVNKSTNDINEQEKSTKALNAQLKEAKREAQILAQQFGENSKEAIAAQKKVAELAEAVDDFNARVKALDPKAKFEAFGQVASSLAGGFAAAQGAAALFGGESEEVQKMLLKVQAAMAFAQGIKQFMEIGDAIKNVQVVLGITKAMKQEDIVVTEEQTVAEGMNAEAKLANAEATEMATVAEEGATVATKGLSVAIKTLLITSGLILLPLAVEAVTAAFKAFSESDFKLDDIVKGIESEKKAHEMTTASIKEQQSVRQTDAEVALNLAKAKGKSIEEVAKLQEKVIDINRETNRKERAENEVHIDALKELNKKFTDENLKKLDDDEREKAIKQKEANDAEIKATQEKNTALLNEDKKLSNDKEVLAIETQQAIIDRQNKIANLRISLIQDEQKRELAEARQAAKEQVEELKKDAVTNATEIGLVYADLANKEKDIKLKYDLQEMQERNQIKLLKTKEGTLERLEAEIKAEQEQTAKIITNTRLTATQKELIQVESLAKIRELENEKLAIIERNNQIEIELLQRKALAEVELKKAASGGNAQEQYIQRINLLNLETQAAIEAKEREADERKAQAQQTITDANELAKQIILIDETIAAEKLLILKQSNTDYATATTDFQMEQLANETLLYQLKVDQFKQFSNEKMDADIASTREQYAKDKLALEQKFRDEKGVTEQGKKAIELLNKKYANIEKQILQENENQKIEIMSSSFGQAAALFKQHTAAYKILATAQAVMDTYKAANMALTAYLPPFSYIAAGVTIATGLANVIKIQGIQFKDGGYTGDGNINEQSFALGAKPYTYHKGEYVVPNKVLKTPEGMSLVNNLEQMRVGNSFAEGGYTLPASGYAGMNLSFINEAGNKIYDQYYLENSLIKAARLTPPPIVTVEDINTGQTRVDIAASRANI